MKQGDLIVDEDHPDFNPYDARHSLKEDEIKFMMEGFERSLISARQEFMEVFGDHTDDKKYEVKTYDVGFLIVELHGQLWHVSKDGVFSYEA